MILCWGSNRTRLFSVVVAVSFFRSSQHTSFYSPTTPLFFLLILLFGFCLRHRHRHRHRHIFFTILPPNANASKDVTVTVSSVIIDNGMVCTAGCLSNRKRLASGVFDRQRPTDRSLFSRPTYAYPRPNRRYNTGESIFFYLFIVRYNAESTASTPTPPPHWCTDRTRTFFRGSLAVCVGDLSLYVGTISLVGVECGKSTYYRCSEMRVLILVAWHGIACWAADANASFVTRPIGGRDQCDSE